MELNPLGFDIMYLTAAILILIIVLLSLPTLLKEQIEEAAKKYSTEANS